MASGCNECDEALDALREGISRARRLVLVAGNSIANCDFLHARSVLGDVVESLEGLEARAGGPSPVSIRR
jgi:hypothetical protein